MGGRTVVKRAEEVRVSSYIVGVSLFRQGDDDMSCGYYCYWMLRIAYEGKDGYEAWCKKDGGPPRPRSGRSPGRMERDLRQVSALKDGEVDVRSNDDTTGLWDKVVRSLERGRPCVLFLPKSEPHPEGHYVVAKGVVQLRDASVPYLVVADPLYGERWLSQVEFRARRKRGKQWAFVPRRAPKLNRIR